LFIGSCRAGNVTAVVDRTPPRPAGALYTHLTLTNSTDISQWVGSCSVPAAAPGGATVVGEVRGITIVPPHSSEPLHGIVTKDGEPIQTRKYLDLMTSAPWPCISSPKKTDVLPGGG